jgi:hypothetical protein
MIYIYIYIHDIYKYKNRESSAPAIELDLISGKNMPNTDNPAAASEGEGEEV